MEKIQVLDKGYVILHAVLGDDLTAVNAARVSYNEQSLEMNSKDQRLLKYLADHDHTSPFRHSILQFEVYAPLMVARQWWKYIVGSDHRDPFTAWNESSRRYVKEDVEFYIPTSSSWREAPKNSKQGSGDFVADEIGQQLTQELVAIIENGEKMYQKALIMGIAPEQARLFLPAYGLYVRWYWTGSLQSVAHFLKQRTAKDAQKEIQDYAKAVFTLAKTKFPLSLEYLLGQSDTI